MAQKLTHPGFAVGKALDSWVPNEPMNGSEPGPIGKIDAFLAVSWADPGVVVDIEGDAAETVETPPTEEPTTETPSTTESTPAEETPSEPEPVTQKIIPSQIEADEGVFRTLKVAVEAIISTLRVEVARIATAFIDNLTAKFIKTDEIEAGKVKVSSPAVGMVTIPAGETVFLVEYQEIKLDSKVFVTPEEPLPLGVIIKEGEGFEIKLKEPLESDLKVSYWIIN